ncbi:nucleotide-binding domain-containing protein [Atractiella rhizophila]|nr:nucleotide-binding domain-containing protein [Atractiella rhizophila]
MSIARSHTTSRNSFVFPLLRRKASSSSRKLNVAIVGGGPAGFYAASRILDSSSVTKFTVDLFELLPMPFGLSRFGVAPDHPEVKNCENKFTETAKHPDFRFFGNVQITGPTFESSPSSTTPLVNTQLYPHAVKVPFKDLQLHYDAILLSYGASVDRHLGIPREDSFPNVISARAFVNWYNGHPYSPYKEGLPFDLSSTEDVSIVGQGNVALDVARILLKPVEELERTDMPQYALETLRKAQVKKIEIVGRRGPLQMACTTKEVRELMNIPRTAFFLDEVDKGHLKTASAELAENGDSVQNGRMMKRIFDLLQKGSKVSPEDSSKSWTFKFLKAPLGLVEEDGGKMKAVQWGSNQLLHDRHNSKASKVTAIPGVVETRKADVLFKSIGYRSVGIDGLPMDEKTSTYKNENGRILDQAGRRVPGLYAAGWLARGPTGVIADTLSYAYDSADSLILDSRSCRNPHRTEDASLENYRKKLEKDGAVIWKGWQAIDAEERRRGGRIGKERVKITDVHEALKVARTT